MSDRIPPSIDRELGALSAQVKILIDGEQDRVRDWARFGRELADMRSNMESQFRSIDEKLKAITGPVEEYKAFRARAGYIVTGFGVVIFTVWTVLGPPILALLRKAMGYSHD